MNKRSDQFQQQQADDANYQDITASARKKQKQKSPRNLSESVSTSSSSLNNVDPLLAKIKNMTLEDREHQLHVLHGIADIREETPAILKTKIEEMRGALSSVIASEHEQDTIAIRKAFDENPEYVNNLKTNFLRTSDYNVMEAASRLVFHFRRKYELFGEDQLVQDIQQDDLPEKAKEALRNGSFQLLKERDRSGRAVIFCSGEVNALYDMETVSQALFYIVMAMGQDKETQIRGVVFVWYGIGQPKFLNRTKAYWDAVQSLPVRVSGMHMCADYAKYLSLMRWAASKILEGRSLCVLRYHEGTPIECIYNVMTFGIPREALPIRDDGSSDLTNHHRMLEILESREQQMLTKGKEKSSRTGTQQESVSAIDTAAETHNPCISNEVGHDDASSTILIPGPMDVLLGRGRQPASRPGSLKMYHLVLENMEAYDAATNKLEKTRISDHVLEQMKNAGCRFLSERPDGGYVECQHDVARTKVSLVFRNQRRNNKKKKEKQQHQQILLSSGNTDAQ